MGVHRRAAKPAAQTPGRSNGHDPDLPRLHQLLDAIRDSQESLERARIRVGRGQLLDTVAELDRAILSARSTLEQGHGLPDLCVTMLGQLLARLVIARAGARAELAMADHATQATLLDSARRDVQSVTALPSHYLDTSSRQVLGGLSQILK